MIIAMRRLGAHVPTPRDRHPGCSELHAPAKSGFLDLANLFSGPPQLAVFGLGIAAYITSSIIMQLLTVVIPKLEAVVEGGGRIQEDHPMDPLPDGHLHASAGDRARVLVPSRRGRGEALGVVISQFRRRRVGILVLSLTAGTALVIGDNELITQRGIEDGMSSSSSPRSSRPSPRRRTASSLRRSSRSSGFLILIGARRDRGHRADGTGSKADTRAVEAGRRAQAMRKWLHLHPLQVNQAGVIPIIFASSVLYIHSSCRPRFSTRPAGLHN